MSLPRDGYGIYEQLDLSGGSGVWLPRLTQIASGGFKLVLNYNLLAGGHIASVISYINDAASLGLKVIVALNDPAIWQTNSYAARFPEIYADSGNAATGALFATYVVNQVKSLPGVWGYYVGEEVANSLHATFKPYSDAIAIADATHPRLFINSATDDSVQNAWQGGSLFWDCAEVTGDSYDPLNFTSLNNAGLVIETTNTVATGVQSYCNTHSVQSALVVQAFNASNYSTQICAPWPTCATFPTRSQMTTQNLQAVVSMQPRLLLWYSYFDILASDNPTGHWADLVAVINPEVTHPALPLGEAPPGWSRLGDGLAIESRTLSAALPISYTAIASLHASALSISYTISAQRSNVLLIYYLAAPPSQFAFNGDGSIIAPDQVTYTPRPVVGRTLLASPLLQGYRQMTWVWSVLQLPEYLYLLSYYNAFAPALTVTYPDEEGVWQQRLLQLLPPNYGTRETVSALGLSFTFTGIL